MAKGQTAKQEAPPVPFIVPEKESEWRKVVGDGMVAAQHGKKGAAVDNAMACLRKHPGVISVDLHDPLPNLFAAISGPNTVYREILLQEAETHRAKLRAGKEVSPLESLLIDRIVVCQMQIAVWQQQYQQKLGKEGGFPISGCKWYDGKLESLNRQYLAAIKTLAQVRRLQIPTLNVALPGSVQVNVGEKQVNLAQSGAALVNASVNAPG